MTDKQQSEPPLTQEEIINLEKALFEVLYPLAPDKKREMYNDIGSFLEINHENIVNIERDIRNTFRSEDTKQIKRLVCIVCDFLSNDRKNAYDRLDRWISDNPQRLTFLDLRDSLTNTCRLADKTTNHCLTTIERALKNSPHYFFNGEFVLKPHTGAQEVIDGMKTSRFEKVNSYIKNAEDFLQLEKPLYKESMKASIDALELFIYLLTGKKDIKKGIKTLERKGVDLHPAFMEAMENLYDFTSDEVRHPKQRPVQVDKETALFMLVACSAIINIIEARSPKKNSK